MSFFDLSSMTGLQSLQVAGTAMSTIGSYFGAETQKTLLTGEANLDLANAQSQALSINTAAGLDEINAKTTLAVSLGNAARFDIQSKSNYSDALLGIGIDVSGAKAGYQTTTHQADLSVLQAGVEADQMRIGASINAIKAGSAAEALRAGAQMSTNVAKLNELQAQAALLQGQNQEVNVRQQGAAVKSKQKVRFAAGNIDMSQGSAVNVLTSTDLVTEQAAIDIQQRTLMAAFGERMQAESAKMDATMKTVQADSLISQSTLESGLTDAKANALAANVKANSDLQKGLAGINLNLATAQGENKTVKAEATLSNNNAESATSRVMALAGYNNTMAKAAYNKVMAKVNLDNATAAANTKRTAAQGINPVVSAGSTLLTSLTKSAPAWYALAKAFD